MVSHDSPRKVDFIETSSDLDVSMDGLTDEERLAQLGLQPELQRTYSLPALAALCVCLMATWEALSSVITAALVSGGPPCLFYNYVASFLCTMCIALSLAEIASMYPTAGGKSSNATLISPESSRVNTFFFFAGQYHWVAALCPSATKLPASFATGWISIGGQIVFTASAAFAAGLQSQALITLNVPTYDPARWQGVLFYWGILLYAGVLNIWGMKLMPHINLVSGVIHIVAFVAVVGVLGALSQKNSAEFVFTEFVNGSGWDSDVISWLVGLLSTVYPFLGYDAATHLAEELPNPSRNVPLAMVGSVTINGVMGLAYTIILLYSAGPLESLVSTPTGFPYMQILLDATKSQAAVTVLSLMLILVATAATIAGVTSTSRTLWAFARDKATPCHEYLSAVNSTVQLPVRAVITVLVFQFLLGVIYVFNATAFNAVLSMAIIGLYLSYTLPIFYMFFYGRRNLKKEDYGPFRLKPWVGAVFNVVGMVWMTIAMVFSCFPSTLPVTALNMNYCIVVLAAWGSFGIFYYLWAGKHKFQLPITDVSVIAADSPVPSGRSEKN